MKKILITTLLIAYALPAMAIDITWADKSTGGIFSAADANAVKSAVNSKATAGGAAYFTDLSVSGAFTSTAPDGTHYFDVTNGVSITATATDERVANYNSVFWVANGTNWTSEYLVKSTKIPQHFGYAISDETTDLTTGTAKITDRMPCAFTVTGVRGVLSTVATGATLVTIDINDSGTTILSTKLTFDASESTTTTAVTPAVISDTAIAKDAVITIDIDAVGNTTTGKGAKIWLDGYCSE